MMHSEWRMGGWRAAAVGAMLAVAGAGADTAAAQAAQVKKTPKAPKTPDTSSVVDTTPRRLFRDRDVPLRLTVTTELRKFVRMRERGRPPLGAQLEWRLGDDTAAGRAPIQVATRGNFRLKDRNCDFPPVRLLFTKDSLRKTLFAGQKRLKLVTRCNAGREYEQYILQEYALYEAHNLVTPLSFRARLVRVSYRDQLGKEAPVDTWGFLIEDDGDMAERNGGKITDAKNALFDDLDVRAMGILGFWEYFIGNTDWSVGALHNIKLVLGRDASVYPVAYDFDFSGAVNTRYSTPDPQLRIRSVTDRLYRGRCLPDDQVAAVVDLFNARKAAIYAIYDRLPELDPKVVKRTREYFDEFYQTINDPRLRKRRILDDCIELGN